MIAVFSRRTNWQLEPNRFTQAHQEILRQGRKVLDLTISNPTRAGFAYDDAAILDSLKHPASLDYDPQPKGMRSAREAVAAYCSCGAGVPARKIDPENLVLTTSTSEGYSYVFRLLCNPEDELLVPKPSYPLFEFLADLQDVNLVPYQLIYDHGWQIDWPALEGAVTDKARAVVLVNPNNPTGSYVSEDERRRLNGLCSDRSLALIVDEVFLDYSLDGRRPHQSFGGNNAALTFTLSGLSKISALPQMKLAWIAVSGPSPQINSAMQRLEVIADTYLSLNAPVQLATPTLLEQRRKVQPQLQQRISANLAELDRHILNQKSCARLAIEGGWYAILRVPVTRSDEDLAIELLHKTGVLLHPGHFYDFPQDGFLVLSLITQPDNFCEGISRALEFLNRPY